MLARENRIRKRKEIQEILDKGKWWQGSLFALVWRPAKNMRAVVICSKKIDKRAVGRNRIKRVVLEAWQKSGAEEWFQGEAVFLVKKAIEGKGIKELLEETLRFKTEIKKSEGKS